jgi:hypothetical protein
MKDSPAAGTLHAATVSLAAALGCVALFLPPLLDDTLASPWRAAATGAALGVTLLLHWIFLGLAARRLQRSVAAWVALSVLVFPIGSALALVLLGWLAKEPGAPARPMGAAEVMRAARSRA